MGITLRYLCRKAFSSHSKELSDAQNGPALELAQTTKKRLHLGGGRYTEPLKRQKPNAWRRWASEFFVLTRLECLEQNRVETELYVALRWRTTVQATNLDLFEDVSRWPRRPYCSFDKTASSIRTLRHALKRPYIQANPPHLRIWSIYDIDRPGGMFAWDEANLPPPAWGAGNPENAHAHLVWGITAPVLVDSPDMRQAPLRYLCAIEAAFRAKMQADQGYSGLMTKNPAHEQWRVWRGPVSSYELGYLAEWVELPKHLPKKKPEEIGLGRNVTLFENLRQYAYRHIRYYKVTVRNFIHWQAHVYHKALDRNGDFACPLQDNEVFHVAKSVSKWTWNKFDLAASDARFSKLQSHRGKQGMLSRWGNNEDKQASAKLMAAAGRTQREIAVELGVSQKSVSNWLRA